MAKGNKTGGRVQGTPNKVTIQMRECLSNLISDELSDLKGTLDQLSPKDRLDAVIRLLPFIMPKMNIEPESNSERLQIVIGGNI